MAPVYGASREDTLAWWRTVFRLGCWRGPQCLAEGGDGSREARLSSQRPLLRGVRGGMGQVLAMRVAGLQSWPS